MKKTIALLFIICIGYSISASIQDKRAKITDYLNKEIRIVDNFAGQSITLIKENNNYYIHRKFHGSGLPEIGSLKYKVVFNSDYQISFSEIVKTSSESLLGNNNEEFLLSSDEKGISLYLNRLKVVITVN